MPRHHPARAALAAAEATAGGPIAPVGAHVAAVAETALLAAAGCFGPAGERVALRDLHAALRGARLADGGRGPWGAAARGVLWARRRQAAARALRRVTCTASPGAGAAAAPAARPASRPPHDATTQPSRA